jgi:hypothetical protein
MDSLSVGISVPMLWGQRTKLPGLQTASGERLPIVFQADQIAGNSDHDPVETVITMLWN